MTSCTCEARAFNEPVYEEKFTVLMWLHYHVAEWLEWRRNQYIYSFRWKLFNCELCHSRENTFGSLARTLTHSRESKDRKPKKKKRLGKLLITSNLFIEKHQ